MGSIPHQGCQWQRNVYRDPLQKNVRILVVTIAEKGDAPTCSYVKSEYTFKNSSNRQLPSVSHNNQVIVPRSPLNITERWMTISIASP